MTAAVTHPAPDNRADHVCACMLPPPAQLRAIRKAAHVGLSTAAARLGVDTMTVSRWERGLHEPRERYIASYLKLLAEFKRQALRHNRPQE